MSTVIDFYKDYQSNGFVGQDFPSEIKLRYDVKACLKMSEYKQVYLVTSKTNWKKFIMKAVEVQCQENLEAEYHLIKMLSHPGIVSDCQLIKGDKCNYLIREYMEGSTITELLEMTKEGHLKHEEILRITLQLCDILQYLHEQTPPIIHRDIKPDNIIITKGGECKLIDFGISRRMQDGAEADTVIMGTQLLAPPEQYGYTQTDPRSDIYALGILMFYMATGSYQIKELQQFNINKKLLKIIKKCTQFSPKERYSSIKQLKNKLIGFPYKGKKRWFVWKSLLGLYLLATTIGCIVWGLKYYSLCKEKMIVVKSIEQNETVPISDEKVYEFKSALIEAAVRNVLSKSPGEPVTYGDLKKIDILLICGEQIYDKWEDHFVYGSNQYMNGTTYKEDRYRRNGEITSIEDIAYMPNLKQLAIYNQRISDISPLEELHELNYLGLGSNNIQNLEPILQLKSLNYLDISANPITNEELEKLNVISSLWGLDISETKVTSINGIRNMKLNFLSLFECKMGDCDGLEDMVTLDNLILTGVNNAITEQAIDKVSTLSKIKILKIFGSGNFDLKKLSNLKSLELLDLCGMWERANFQELELPSLIQLYVPAFKDLDLNGIEKNAQLTEIFLQDSACDDYSPLLKMTNLKKVYCNQEQKNDILDQLGSIPFELVIN